MTVYVISDIAMEHIYLQMPFCNVDLRHYCNEFYFVDLSMYKLDRITHILSKERKAYR